MKTLILRSFVMCAFIGILFSCKKDPASLRIEPNENTSPPKTTNPVTKEDLGDKPETQPPVLSAVTKDITSNCGGYFKAIPVRYDSGTKKYPLILFLHGQSALGNGTEKELSKVASGPFNLIKKKQFPAGFTVAGKNHSFIMIAPQFKSWPTADDINAVINYFISALRIDQNRIYVTGLSMGGGATWDYAGKYASKVAAIVPVCGASAPNDQKAKMMAEKKLPVWAFHNQYDNKVSVDNTTGYVNLINKYKPNPKPKATIFQDEDKGHDAWTKAYSLTYKENNMNIYEWMLQFHR